MGEYSRESTSYLSFAHVLDGDKSIAERQLTCGALVRVHSKGKRQKLGAADEESVIGIVGTVVGTQVYICVVCKNNETDRLTHDWLWCPLRHLSSVDRTTWSNVEADIRQSLVQHAWTASVNSAASDASSEIARAPRTRHSLSSSPKDKSPPVIDLDSAAVGDDVNETETKKALPIDDSGCTFTEALDFGALGGTANDHLVVGRWLEVQHPDDPLLVRLATIEDNHGGYLKVALNDYVHYLHERVHAVGWATSVEGVAHLVKYSNVERLDEATANAVNAAVFESANKCTVTEHRLEVGMRCELMDPVDRVEFGAAAITKLHGPFYFSVVKDSIRALTTSPVKECVKIEEGVESKPQPIVPRRSLTSLLEAQHRLKQQESTAAIVNGTPPKQARLSVASPTRAPPPALQASTSAPVLMTSETKTTETKITTSEEKMTTTDVAAAKPQEWICHRESLNILPATWCARNAVRISPPQGYPDEQEFSWAAYRAMTELTTWDQASESYFPTRPYSAAHAFPLGTVLEVVDDTQPHRLLPATVTRTFKHIVWLRFDHISSAVFSRAYHCKSLELFPSGFATANRLPLADRAMPLVTDVEGTPGDAAFNFDEPSVFFPVERPYMMSMYAPGSTSWSPPLYVNESCCVGPYFTRAGILRKVQREFPAAPLHLQLQTVLIRLLYASTRMQTMIDIWKSESFYKSDARVPIKFCTARRPTYARDKRTFTMHISVPSSSSDLPAYLRHVLSFVDACPSLISTEHVPVGTPCPYDCHRVLDDKCNAATTHPMTGYKAQRSSMKRGRGRTNAVPTSLLSHPLPDVKRKRRMRKQRERIDDDDDETRSDAQRRPVTRGVRVKLVRPHPSSHTATQQAAGRISRNIRQQMTHKESRRSSIMSPTKQRMHKQYTFAQIRDKPIGITIPRRKSGERRGRPRITKEEEEMDPIGSRARRIPAIKTDPGTWSAQQLCDWLTACKQSRQLVTNLLDEEVDGHAFMLLTLNDCIDYLNMPFGEALKLVTVVSEVKQVYLRMFGEAETKSAY